jgi:hypothetical protein
MTSETTPHTLQQEHYSMKSNLEGNFFPAMMIVVGLAGIYIMLSSMI